MRKRIAYEDIYQRMDAPLARTISEVGFASSLERLDQHRKYQSSNYIMNLLGAIFISDGGIFKNRLFVIFNCIEPCHGSFGEIICSRYAQAHTSHGGGFSYFVVGVSVANANKHDEPL